MIKTSITVENVIEVLNEALIADPKAMNELILGCKVECNEMLADHPTIQIGYNGKFRLGTLGLLNGLFEIDEKGFGPICAVIDDETEKIVEFRRVSHPVSEQT
jgi:hypothetical protein